MNVFDEISRMGSHSDLQKVFDATNRRWKELDRAMAASFRIGQDVVFTLPKHGKTYGGVIDSINGAGRIKIRIQVVRPSYSPSSAFISSSGTFTCNASWLNDNLKKD